MTADVVIEVARADDVLRVSNAALRFRPPAAATTRPAATARGASAAGGKPSAPSAGSGAAPGTAAAGGPAGGRGEHKLPPGAALVFRVGADGQLERVRIQTGLTDGRFTAVTGGELAAGDSVVVGLAVASDPSSQAPAVRSPFGGRGRF
jgi:HlyD family secretion protein